jgi:MFS family permease
VSCPDWDNRELQSGHDTDYTVQSIVTLVFFTTYIFFQSPATVITRKIGPRIFLGGLCISWGAVMIGMGFANDWAALAACRVILGLFEVSD